MTVLLQGFGIQPHEVALNVATGNISHYVEEQELNPLAYAEQFVDPDPTKAHSPEELLRRARMILATELGKDPILRQEIRAVFKSEAQVSVLPTDRGIIKITDDGRFYVCPSPSLFSNIFADPRPSYYRTSSTFITNLFRRCCNPHNFSTSSQRKTNYCSRCQYTSPLKQSPQLSANLTKPLHRIVTAIRLVPGMRRGSELFRKPLKNI